MHLQYGQDLVHLAKEKKTQLISRSYLTAVADLNACMFFTKCLGNGSSPKCVVLRPVLANNTEKERKKPSLFVL